MNTTSNTPHTPWHLWAVGIISLLWNGFGALDFVMTQTRNVEYMSAFTPEQLAFFYSFPTWVNVTWALGIWGAVLGSLLLLFKSRFAVPIFRLSLLGMVITAIHNNLLSEIPMGEVVGPTALIFTAVIFLVALALFWYAKLQRSQGILR